MEIKVPRTESGWSGERIRDCGITGKTNGRSQRSRPKCSPWCQIADSSKKGIGCARFMKPSSEQNVTFYMAAARVRIALVAIEEKGFPWAHSGS